MSTQHPGILTSISQSELFELDHQDFNTLRYIATRIASCWHLRLSRPITHGRETYRSCLRCGMHRKFDLEQWKSSGRFYSPSVERRSS